MENTSPKPSGSGLVPGSTPPPAMQAKLPDLNGDSASKAKPSFRMLNFGFCCLPLPALFARVEGTGGWGWAEGESIFFYTEAWVRIVGEGEGRISSPDQGTGFCIADGRGRGQDPIRRF